MTLLETRNKYRLTQESASTIIGVPLRTYRRYETDDHYGNSIKREAFIRKLEDHCEIAEEKGLWTIEEIKTRLKKLFDDEYPSQINFCYLFGSYAKGNAKPDSDVDLYVSSSLKGFKLTGLMEQIRQTLHKRVDVLRDESVLSSFELAKEIFKTGIKIYVGLNQSWKNDRK